MTREKAGYRGPVRYVRLERQQENGPYIHETWFQADGRLAATSHTNPDGSTYRTDYTYDENSDLIDPTLQRRIVRNADGTRCEVDRIPVERNFFWGRIAGLEKAGSLGFATRMASQISVNYDVRGVPTEAIFTYDSGDVASRIEFRSDAAGNITEILQYGGSQPSLPLSPDQIASLSEEDRYKFGAFLTAGALEIRTYCSYDEAGHLVEQTTYFGNEVSRQTVWTYNEHGEISTTTEKDGWPVRHEYEYDNHGNWTRQVVTHGMGSDETLRKFEYHE